MKQLPHDLGLVAATERLEQSDAALLTPNVGRLCKAQGLIQSFGLQGVPDLLAEDHGRRVLRGDAVCRPAASAGADHGALIEAGQELVAVPAYSQTARIQPRPSEVPFATTPRAGRYSQPTQPCQPLAADTSSITLNR